MNIIIGLLYLTFAGIMIAVWSFVIKVIIPKFFGTLSIPIIIGLVVGAILSLLTFRYAPVMVLDAMIDGWKLAAPKMVELSNMVIADYTAIVDGTMFNSEYGTQYSVEYGDSPFSLPEVDTEPKLSMPDYIPTATPIYTVPENSDLHSGAGDPSMWQRPSADGTTGDSSTDNAGGGAPSSSFNYDEWEVGDPIPTPMITPMP